MVEGDIKEQAKEVMENVRNADQKVYR